jgi:hypothetical protein
MKRLWGVLLALALVACAPSQAQIATAIAQTQVAVPTNTETPVPTLTSTAIPSTPTATYTPRPTQTQRPSPTTAPTATETPLGAIDHFALNALTSIEQSGLAIDVARVGFFSRQWLLTADGEASFVTKSQFDGVDVFGEIILRMTNTTDGKLMVYPDQGTIIIGNEQIELSDARTGIGGLDDLGGDIFPGVTKVGGVWFGVRRSTFEQITSVLFAFKAPFNADFRRTGEDFEIVLDVSNHEFQPYPDDL